MSAGRWETVLLLSTGHEFTSPRICRKCHILELLTLPVSKQCQSVGKLYKLCVYVYSHLVWQWLGRGKEKPERRQPCSHWWKPPLSFWSASLTYYFPHCIPIFVCRLFPHCHYFSTISFPVYIHSISPSLSFYTLPSPFPIAPVSPACKLSSSLSFSTLCQSVILLPLLSCPRSLLLSQPLPPHLAYLPWACIVI